TAPSNLDRDNFPHRRWRLPEAELPRVDIILVTSNAAENLEKFLTSIAKLAYPAEKLRLTLVDNASIDDTVGAACRAAAISGMELRLICQSRNVGLGPSRNAGARAQDGPYLFFLNATLEPDPACLRELVEAASALPDAALVEARQLPHEDGKL